MAKKPKKDSGATRPLFVHPNAYHVFTDGSFRPTDAAACAYVIFSERTKHIVKASRWAFRGATNNQMELQAVNKALDHPNMDHVIIYSDSTYVISCLTLWRKAWEHRNWVTPLGEPVKNKELIQEIAEKIDRKQFVRFVKVLAHSGDPFNSMADYLAGSLTKMMVENPNLESGEYPVG